LKKTDRELIRRERRKPSRSKKTQSALGPFAILGRVLLVFTPVVVIALLMASFLTPLFAIEKIVVAGTERLDEKKLAVSLEPLKGKSLTLISDSEIAGLLAGYELIETFTFQAEPPSTLRVKVRERQPLLILQRSGQNFLFDAAGVRIGSAENLQVYPQFDFDGNPESDPRFAHAVELMLSLPVELYLKISTVRVSEQLTSNFTLRQGSVGVIWGDNSQALLKAEVLNSLLATGQKPGVRIDVSSPNAPVVSHD
jgi:cell division protein FtsQ